MQPDEVPKNIPKGITPQIAVLGLLVQGPDTTFGVSRRLKEQFPTAQFADSSAHNNVKSLEKAGYLRRVPKEGTPIYQYEVTDAGREYASRWLLSVPPPKMRDPLQCKLAFVGREQVDMFIRCTNEEKELYRREYNRVHSEWQGHKRLRAATGDTDWRSELEAMKLKDEVEHFLAEVLRRKNRVKELEELLSRLED